MKKYILGILVVLLVIFASGCIGNNSSDDDNKTQVQTIAQNGVLIKFPADWVLANSQSNNSLVSVVDPASLDSSNVGKINVNVQKMELSGSLDSFVNNTYKSMESNSSITIQTLGSVVVGNYEGIECIYFEDDGSDVKQHRAIWIEHGSEVYVVLCTAPQSDFDGVAKYFDFIVNNFRIT